MSNQQALEREIAGAPGDSQHGSPPGLDINAETYPFDVVVNNLDKAAYFHFFSNPKPGECTLSPGGGPHIGFRIHEDLRRFDTPVYSSACESLSVLNVVGESLASFESRWMPIPDWFQARPGVAPPPQPFDGSRRQRFVMLDAVCRFGDGRHGFEGFGSGVFYPLEKPGGHLAAGAVGSISRGFGKFEGLAGTYTYAGELCPRNGFRGSLLLRVIDPEDRFHSTRQMPLLEPAAVGESGVTYVVLRGQKSDRLSKTGFLTDSAGQITGLLVGQQLRVMRIDAGCPSVGEPFASAHVGPVIGEMKARIRFNLTNPGAPGTLEAPIPFQSENEFTLYDGAGGTLGTISSDGGEGRTFQLALSGVPRQAALRFGAFQPILGGTGRFEGIRGMLTDNSAVGIAPHAIVTFYVLRIEDPKGKYRARLQRSWS